MRARSRWTIWMLAVALVAIGLTSAPTHRPPPMLSPQQPGSCRSRRSVCSTRGDGTGQAVPAHGLERHHSARRRRPRWGAGDGVVAVVMNVTATGASGPGFVTVWPATQTRADGVEPQHRATRARPSPTSSPCSSATDGAVSLFAMTATHLVADVAGYFTPSGPTAAGRPATRRAHSGARHPPPASVRLERPQPAAAPCHSISAAPRRPGPQPPY